MYITKHACIRVLFIEYVYDYCKVTNLFACFKPSSQFNVLLNFVHVFITTTVIII